MNDLRIEFFTEENATDAKYLVESRFAPGTSAAIDHILQVPWRPQGEPAGVVLYEAGKPVCFRALIARHYFFGQLSLTGVVGSMLCKLRGVSSDCVREVMRQTTKQFRLKNGEVNLYLTNSAVPRNIALHKELGIESYLSQAWLYSSIAVLRPLVYVWQVFQRKVLRSEPSANIPVCIEEAGKFEVRENEFCVNVMTKIDRSKVDTFWQAYLKNNEGLVASRTSKELEWMYGARLSAGEAAFLVCEDSHGVAGYIVLVTDGSRGCRWYIADMIALGNNSQVLSLLLRSVKIFLRECTPAVICTVVGFPDSVQKMIQRWRTFTRKRDCSSLIFKAHEETLTSQILDSLSRNNGWAFCPYDGDLYL